MEIDLFELLKLSPPILIFSILFLGHLLGKFKLGAFRLGSSIGVLMVGLVLGELGFKPMHGLDTIGFILFIYCIGLQTGPQFFSIFLEDGLKYICLAAVVAISAIGMALIISYTNHYSASMTAGMLAGSLSSTPALISAQDTIRSLFDHAPNEMQIALRDISIGYALTYLIGTIGLLALFSYSPKILGVNLKEESDKLAQKRLDRKSKTKIELPIVRAFSLSESTVKAFEGKTLRQLALKEKTGCVIDKIRRSGSIFEPDGDTALMAGDAIALVGHSRKIYKFPYYSALQGEESFDKELLDYEFLSQEVVMGNKQFNGVRLGDLKIDEFGCFVSKVSRSQIEMPTNDDLIISRGDVLEISGEKGRLERLIERIGHVDQNSQTTDVFTFTLGIVIGLIFGHFVVKVAGINLTLGNAGGLLLSGIIIGHFRNNHPTFGRVPPAATYILTELGSMLFMSNVGLNAGGHLVKSFALIGPNIFIAAIGIMFLPIFFGYLFGRFVLKLNIVLLLGALTGARTSTSGLNILTDLAKSNVPALSYAATYAFANVFMTLAGILIINLL